MISPIRGLAQVLANKNYKRFQNNKRKTLFRGKKLYMNLEMPAHRVRRLFEELYRLGPLSNQEIATRFDLSPASITHLLQPLIQSHMLEILPPEDYPLDREDKNSGIKRRRKATVTPNGSWGYVLTVDIGARFLGIRKVGFDLQADLAFFETIPLHSGDKVVETIVHSIQTLEKNIPGKLLGLGVTVAGRKNPQDGTVSFGHIEGLASGFDLAGALSQALGIPCVLENDANALAIYERFAGEGRHREHFMCLFINEGVGLGILANGQLYQGFMNHAGESGHLIVNPQGPRLADLPQGSVEAYVGRKAVAAHLAQAGIEAPDYQVWKTLAASNVAGSPGETVFQGIVGTIALLSVNLIHLFAPETIFIYGPLAELGPIFRDPLHLQARQLTSANRAEGVARAITTRTDWKTAMAIGTAKSTIDQIILAGMGSKH